MIGLALQTNAGFLPRSADSGSAGEPLNSAERQSEQARQQTLPVGSPQSAVGGLTANAVAGTSQTTDANSDVRRPFGPLPTQGGNGVELSSLLAVQEDAGGVGQINTNTQGEAGALPATGESEEDLAPNELTPEEQAEVDRLAARDREVRAHEQAHARVGGAFASQPSYETVTGPDGQQYAVAGEVQIDAAPIPGDPEGTIRKLDIVIRAALAPAEPSSQDLAVARQARADQAEARTALREQRSAELEGASGGDEEDPFAINGSEESEQTAEQAEQLFGLIQSQNSLAGQLFGGGGTLA